ncbi:hypothetical protein AZ46_0218655 [Metabacillus indicus LMG 22858]|nr:hypothetical protein AZ46_0218655 [Metabacillus indicus LMG 22858]
MTLHSKSKEMKGQNRNAYDPSQQTNRAEGSKQGCLWSFREKQRISLSSLYLSGRKEPSTADFVWLVVLIRENGTNNSGYRLVGGTYRGERNPQVRISFGWWYL